MAIWVIALHLQVMGVIVAEAPESFVKDEFSQISRLGQSVNMMDQMHTMTKEDFANVTRKPLPT